MGFSLRANARLRPGRADLIVVLIVAVAALIVAFSSASVGLISERHGGFDRQRVKIETAVRADREMLLHRGAGLGLEQ
jgi:hypothetical protein